MYMNRTHADAYKRAGVETLVHEADPHRLITMLLEGLMQRLRLAESCAQQGEATRKAKASAEAGAIIASLSASLNMKEGGEIAERLEALYEYCGNRLMAANANNDPKGFAEVAGLIGEIQRAWTAMSSDGVV